MASFTGLPRRTSPSTSRTTPSTSHPRGSPSGWLSPAPDSRISPSATRRPTVTTTDDVASLADLLTTAFADSSAVEPGGQLTYNWSVNNSGPAASTGTVLTGTVDGA